MISRARPEGSIAVTDRPPVPEILLCIEGELEICVPPSTHGQPAQVLVFKKSESLFIPASETAYRISGTGELFRAGLPALK
jgi:mannose-6-phosphate isomerase class I